MAGALACALGGAQRAGRLPAPLQPLMGGLLGWTATLLFMFQPLAQLVSSRSLRFLEPFGFILFTLITTKCELVINVNGHYGLR